MDLNRQTNQIKEECEWRWLRENKHFIFNKITHIIDIDGWHIDGKVVYAEASVYDLRDLKMSTFNFYHPYINNMNDKDWKTVMWLTRNIHGLKLLSSKEHSDDITYEEFVNYLHKGDDVLYAYKGGSIEKDLCRKINVKSLNLELFDCLKYEELLTYFNLKNKTCCRHSLYKATKGLPHCPRYEVYVFALYILYCLKETHKFQVLCNQYCDG